MLSTKKSFPTLANTILHVFENTSPKTNQMSRTSSQSLTPQNLCSGYRILSPRHTQLKRRRTLEYARRRSNQMILLNVATTILKPAPSTPKRSYIQSPYENASTVAYTSLNSPENDQETISDTDKSIIRNLDFSLADINHVYKHKKELESPASSEESCGLSDFSNSIENEDSRESDVELDTPTKAQVLVKGLEALPTKPQIVGQGGFGIVIKARSKGSNVAVKIIRKCRRRKQSIQYCLQGELNAISLIHPNIVRTFKILGFEEENALILMEYAGHKNLQKVLDDVNEVFTTQRIYKFANQIISAILCCHTKNLAHLDIKPANVIVSCKDICKLCDFGCSQQLDVYREPYKSTLPLDGTVSYRAPELLRGSYPTLQADIYSYGITLWQILSREVPFANMEPHTIIYKVVACKERPSLPKTELKPLLSLYVDLFQRCWIENGEERPSASSIKDYVTEICENV